MKTLPRLISTLVALGITTSFGQSPAPQWVLPAINAPRVQHRTFESAAAKTRVSYFIYTPESYDTEKEQHLPVLYWLHGTGGGLAGVRPLAAYFDSAIRAGKIPPMLVVFANGLATSMWCDSRDGSVPMETVVVKELVPHVDATFRTAGTREGRLIEGFSMGGYGAARLGFKHHDVFGAVSILAGGPLDLEFQGPRATANPEEREQILKTVFGGDLEYFKAQSPWVLAEQNAAAVRGKTRVRMATGERDLTLGLNRQFSAQLRKLNIPHTFTMLPGVDHNPMALLNALGEENWRFYRAVFGKEPKPASSAGPSAARDATPTDSAMANARRYSEANGGQAMLVMREGKIIFEGYGNGGAADRRQILASGTKSFIGVLAMAAVEDGFIRLDDAACESLTEWKTDPLKSQITYRQLLTLTSGLTPGERGEIGRNPAWKEIIAKPMTGKPGAQFEYGAYHLNAFGEALQRQLKGETFEQYLTRRLLKPLGITLEWRIRCPDGHPQLGGGAALNARDWAKFGEFMRLGGLWNGKQIIRADLLAECLRGTKQNPAYGLTWWLKETVPEAIIKAVPILQRDMGDIVKSDWLPEDLFMAAGAGKQRLYVIPSLKLVIVRLGELRTSRTFSDTAFLDRLLRGAGPSETSVEKPFTATRPTALPAGMGGAIFGRLDADGDGKVSKEEFQKLGDLGQGRLKENPAMLDQLFQRLNTNKDGALSADEMKALGTLRGAQTNPPGK